MLHMFVRPIRKRDCPRCGVAITHAMRQASPCRCCHCIGDRVIRDGDPVLCGCGTWLVLEGDAALVMTAEQLAQLSPAVKQSIELAARFGMGTTMLGGSLDPSVKIMAACHPTITFPSVEIAKLLPKGFLDKAFFDTQLGKPAEPPPTFQPPVSELPKIPAAAWNALIDEGKNRRCQKKRKWQQHQLGWFVAASFVTGWLVGRLLEIFD